jgi:hypothetical protein
MNNTKSLMASSFWHRCLIVLIATVVSLFAAEYAVRFTQPELNPKSQIRFLAATDARPTLGPANSTLRQIKNTGDYNVIVQFNANGFRDKHNIADARSNDFILVGDSFTFGWGVKEQQRISEQLELLINQRVFNISIPAGLNGYERLLAYAKQRGSKAKRIIIAVSMETDLHIYDATSNEVRGVKEIKPRGASLISIKGFLTQSSALYALVTTLVHRIPLLKSLLENLGIVVSNLEGIRKYEFSLEVIESSAQRLKRIADQYITTVVIIPSRALWHGNFQKIEDRRHQAFVKRVKELKLEALDLRPILERTKNPLSFHFKNDPHWRPQGHRIAARALANHLRQQYSNF